MLLERLTAMLKEIDENRLASMIDSTLLDPQARRRHFEEAVLLVAKYGFKCLMVPPMVVEWIFKSAINHDVTLCAVIGFPAGFSGVESKLAEIRAVSDRVAELDIVPGFYNVDAGIEELERELAVLVDEARMGGVKIVKVIVESPLLSEEDLRALVEASSRVKADFVKTSTGVYSKGGDYYNVARLYRIASDYGLKVKASGGIKTGLDAILAIAAGASRIGTSSAVEVIKSYKSLVSGALD